MTNTSSAQFVDYFDRILAINLPHRHDRRDQVTRELARAGMPVGTNGVDLFPGIRPTDAGGFPSIGYRGCFLSHLESLKLADRDGAEAVLILEDDVVFLRLFAEHQSAIIEQLQDTPWDIAYLGHGVALPDHGGVPVMIPYDGQVMLGHCYAVHRRAFRRMIDFMETLMRRPPGHPDGGPMSHDGAMWTFRIQSPDLVTLIASPSLAFQRPSRSDNSPRWFDRVPVLNRLGDCARVAKTWLARR